MHAWFWKHLANNSQERVLMSQGSKAGAGWFPLASINSVPNEASADVAVYFTNHLLHPAALRAC